MFLRSSVTDAHFEKWKGLAREVKKCGEVVKHLEYNCSSKSLRAMSTTQELRPKESSKGVIVSSVLSEIICSFQPSITLYFKYESFCCCIWPKIFNKTFKTWYLDMVFFSYYLFASWNNCIVIFPCISLNHLGWLIFHFGVFTKPRVLQMLETCSILAALPSNCGFLCNPYSS